MITPGVINGKFSVHKRPIYIHPPNYTGRLIVNACGLVIRKTYCGNIRRQSLQETLREYSIVRECKLFRRRKLNR